MPFLLAEILNFQGSTHHIGVGSFSQILSKTICMEDIKKSRYFPEIRDRMFFFDKIEYLLDSNKTVFLQVLFPKRREGLHKRTSSLYITKKRNNNS